MLFIQTSSKICFYWVQKLGKVTGKVKFVGYDEGEVEGDGEGEGEGAGETEATGEGEGDATGEAETAGEGEPTGEGEADAFFVLKVTETATILDSSSPLFAWT